jgi:hypothetical protein
LPFDCAHSHRRRFAWVSVGQVASILNLNRAGESKGHACRSSAAFLGCSRKARRYRVNARSTNWRWGGPAWPQLRRPQRLWLRLNRARSFG